MPTGNQFLQKVKSRFFKSSNNKSGKRYKKGIVSKFIDINKNYFKKKCSFRKIRSFIGEILTKLTSKIQILTSQTISLKTLKLNLNQKIKQFFQKKPKTAFKLKKSGVRRIFTAWRKLPKTYQNFLSIGIMALIVVGIVLTGYFFFGLDRSQASGSTVGFTTNSLNIVEQNDLVGVPIKISSPRNAETTVQ